MYISYSKLWKYLIDRKMSKTELMSLTGISSRTLAKLSKNQTVTTDTLVKICQTLECDVADIMEMCDGEVQKSFFDVFDTEAVLVSETEYYRSYRMNYGGSCYLVTKSLKSANRHTSISLKPDRIEWLQVTIAGIGGKRVSWQYMIPIKDIRERDCRSIFVVSGGPFNVYGLDDNNYISSKRPPKSSKDIYVMSMAAFKLFEPNNQT